MKTEEILRRAEEYRSVREALGAYLVDLAGPGVEAVPDHLGASPPAPARLRRDPPSDEDAKRWPDRREGSDRAAEGAVRESGSG
jgi:hypothetical protein